MTVADDIRALAAQGLSRAEIARRLGKSYQHVRNVLEGDKLQAAAKHSTAGEASPGLGVAEPPATFGRTYRLNVEEGGVVRLPPEVLAALGTGVGGVLISDLEDDRLVILSNRAAWRRVQDRVASLGLDKGPSVVDELIAERRAEAAREAND
jgi:transcriptional regulator with XRE-family HTH domain